MSKRRNRPSSIDQLPEEIREAIAKIRIQGRTIDEILAHLKTLDVTVSRSALGRHVKTLSEVSERLKTSRDLAKVLTDKFGESSDNRLAQLNLELMHDVILKLVTATKDNEDGDPEPVVFDPKDAHFLARALKDLASAQKTDADRLIIVRKEVARSAAKTAEKVAVERGISAETIKTIREAILGVVDE